MDLKYKILWFEDTDEWYEAVSRRIIKYIDEKNLKVEIRRIKNALDFYISDFDLNDYEVIMVDYKLEDDTYGQQVIKQIRDGNYVNDVVFYSSNGYQELINVTKEEGLQGVFLAERKNDKFLAVTKALINKSIRRSENLINIRGIVMDNTSEFDEDMKDIINCAWGLYDTDTQNSLSNYVNAELMENKKETCKEFTDKFTEVNSSNITDLLNDREFTSDMKARLFNKILNLDTEVSEIMKKQYFIVTNREELEGKIKFKKEYEEDILIYRNKLAHVKKCPNENGEILIGKIAGEEVKFDQALCSKIRRNLIKYDLIFKSIYEQIEKI